MRHTISKLHVPEEYRDTCKFRHKRVCYHVKSKGKLVCPNPDCPGRDDEWSKQEQG
jgi:hypothetical protein